MKTASEMRVIYLHGFASSPASRKARHFLKKLGARGIMAEALDLAPDFEHVTISSQLSVMENAIKGEPAVLIGSSMGGYLAALYAAEHPEVRKLILLAPAFDFYQLWASALGPEKLEHWREKGSVAVFHYGMGGEAPLGYEILADARKYPPFPEFTQPCLILHGRKDSVVPFENSARYAENNPNVTLISLNSDHELTDALDDIWEAASTFLLP
jgi:pimeloyl-ACP methyl ester carboxylesterase